VKKTEELIVQLTRSLGPVTPLSSPSVRLARWSALSVLIATIGVVAVGPRADLSSAIRQPAFLALALMAITTALAAAGGALVLSVPGAERSPAPRALPLVLLSAWTATLVAFLLTEGEPVAHLLALPIHAACVIEIAAFALVPAWTLFTEVRRAAPLRIMWSAVLAGLAATTLATAATQIVCPLDDAAHHLAGHIAPMAVLTILIALGWRHSLEWQPQPVTNL
jgi:hypothetical protein